ncbi:unnamed protein product [Paramecium sonneborni]|uniref:Uncharacterized protein n=1 Tax=Paramecium sonneborni TaxID=65129 RepID=A0A8S1RN73_9CILI|nr:unnamed protein product [Paramecium sonneborni]
MLKPKMLENQQDFHCQNKHDSPIHLIVIDPNLDKKQRLLCSECMENFKSEDETMEFKKVIKIIEDIIEKKARSFENIYQLTVQQLQTCVKSVQELKTQFMELFDSLIRITEDWSQNLLEQVQKCNQYSFYDELKILIIKIKFNLRRQNHNLLKSVVLISHNKVKQIIKQNKINLSYILTKVISISSELINRLNKAWQHVMQQFLILQGQLWYQPKKLILKYGSLQMENQNQQKY